MSNTSPMSNARRLLLLLVPLATLLGVIATSSAAGAAAADGTTIARQDVTGAAYQLGGGFWIEMNVTPGATTQTEVDVFNAIGQGSAPNFTVRGVVHTTVDANGNVTASVDHLTNPGLCLT